MIEGYSLINYLVELNMDVDLSDTNAAVQKIKKAAMMNPSRAAQANVANATDVANELRGEEGVDPIDVKIANLSRQIAMLQQQKARKMKMQGAQVGGV